MRSEAAHLYLLNVETDDVETYVGLGEGIVEHIALVAGYAWAKQELQNNFYFADVHRSLHILALLTNLANMN